MKNFGLPEKVYVENDWYDGPRVGVADIGGVPHRFKSIFDETEDEYSDVFAVWPIDPASLALEIEQWKIFVAWNALFEAGEARLDSHPGHGGINPRYDWIKEHLKSGREVPEDARRALAQVEWMNNDIRYGPDGPDYRLRWHIL